MTNMNPHGFQPPGADLWQQYADAFELEASDAAILRSACECVDLISALDAVTREHGPVAADGKTAASVVEARFQRGILLKLLAQLERLSEPVEGARRNLGGTRGAYKVRGAV